MIKIGDKVRFLNEVGGGRVTGFQKGNIVLVEDDDGFEVPVLTREVIVIESDDYGTEKMVTPRDVPAPEPEPHDMPLPIVERQGGDTLSALLAFVAQKPKEFSTTNFDCYIINDCNYFLRYVCLVSENNSYRIWQEGELEPNTLEFLTEVNRDDLGSLERLTIQMIAYKKDKPFAVKPVIDTPLRLDGRKFYKLHTFVDNDFLEQPALLVTIPCTR